MGIDVQGLPEAVGAELVAGVDVAGEEAANTEEGGGTELCQKVAEKGAGRRAIPCVSLGGVHVKEGAKLTRLVADPTAFVNT